MKIFNKILPFAFIAILFASCSVSRPILITDNASKKTGTAELNVVLGIFRPMEADLSIAKAAKNGGITKVATVDYTVESKLFKTTYKTIVTGE